MAKDLGSRLLKLLLTSEAGLFLVGVCIAAFVKYFWKSKLADQLRQQYKEKKYVLYACVALLGIILWLIQVNSIVSMVGVTLIGLGLGTFLFDSWEEYIFPFVQNNTVKVIISCVGVFLFLFARSIEDSFLGFPALLTVIVGVFLAVGVWYVQLHWGYQKIQEIKDKRSLPTQKVIIKKGV